MMAVEMDWKTQWEAYSDLFVVSNWLEWTQDRQIRWPLPTTFKYFSGGDMNLRAGIIVKTREDQEEEFLKAGLLWAAQLGNGARTVMYFVAPQFSEGFLQVMETFGGPVMCKALYWRERMKPSLFRATDGMPIQMKIEKPDWKTWQRQINPVEASYLKALRLYFESLEPLGARVVFKRNKIVLCRGMLEIAYIKKTGGKLEFASNAKWMGRAAGEKYHRGGWVDARGSLNPEFRTAVEDLIEVISEHKQEGILEAKEALPLLLWEEPGQGGEMWGRCVELPCILLNNKPLDLNKVYFMVRSAEAGHDEVQDLHVVMPILEKPLTRMVSAVWWRELMKDISVRLPRYRWDGRINCLISPACQEELRIALEWIKNRDAFPCYRLDRQWKQKGVLDFTRMT
ncbi:MAG: hypothetical protein FWG14_00805 [Peptococcaceae bacterium]|nr:hypothetical protein [Peptococcaceae bacterium]